MVRDFPYRGFGLLERAFGSSPGSFRFGFRVLGLKDKAHKDNSIHRTKKHVLQSLPSLFGSRCDNRAKIVFAIKYAFFKYKYNIFWEI